MTFAERQEMLFERQQAFQDGRSNKIKAALQSKEQQDACALTLKPDLSGAFAAKVKASAKSPSSPSATTTKRGVGNDKNSSSVGPSFSRMTISALSSTAVPSPVIEGARREFEALTNTFHPQLGE